jgi:hypothetical protein
LPSNISATKKFHTDHHTSPVPAWRAPLRNPDTARWIVLFVLFILPLLPASARTKDKVSYGEGLIVNIPMPIAQVEIIVEDVASNGIIRGTKEYNKDQYVGGAKSATAPHVFPPWTEAGKVFYKVRTEAIDPVNFKDTNDVGTLEVRYILQPQGQKNTVLRIDALFQEEFRHAIHQSNGSVETAEYKDIREHLDSIQVMRQQDAEARMERQEKLAQMQNHSPSGDSSSGTSQPMAQNVPAATDPSSSSSSRVEVPYSAEVASNPDSTGQKQPLTLEQQIKELRRRVERIVKSPGAPLKSAPFHTAGTLQLLASGTEVLIVIDTPYWYGVETHDGQHGWMMRDELEQKP